MAGEQLEQRAPVPWIEEEYVEEPTEDLPAEDEYDPDHWPYSAHH